MTCSEIREVQNKLAASGTHQDAVLVDTVKKKLENIREPRGQEMVKIVAHKIMGGHICRLTMQALLGGLS